MINRRDGYLCGPRYDASAGYLMAVSGRGRKFPTSWERKSVTGLRIALRNASASSKMTEMERPLPIDGSVYSVAR